ncbi:STAS domain-containing protein [Mycobacterium sp.]|uniref:STAS domain-containing protein n=1 Tax=Mycobacterium sp. TaxID=1785 RepID=UPI003F985D2A
MSGITVNAPPAPSVLPDSGFLSQPWEGHTAQLASRRLRSSVAVISAHGHIDASNAATLTEYTRGHLMRCRGLILDLRGLNFFGTEGFSALHSVSVCCVRAGIGWAVLSVRQSPGCCGSVIHRACCPPPAPSRQRWPPSKTSITVHHIQALTSGWPLEWPTYSLFTVPGARRRGLPPMVADCR